LVLCTAAHHSYANAVAQHTGIFGEVLASDESRNLKGVEKATALVGRYGRGGFDYAGNDKSDLHVFAEAREAWVVDPSRALGKRLGAIPNVSTVLGRPAQPRLATYCKVLRPHQWAKNLLVFVPLLATIAPKSLEKLFPALMAFVAFSLVASAGYVLNDLLDLNADRKHPRKRRRPAASGDVPLLHVMAMLPLLLITGFGIAVAVSTSFVATLAVYLAGTVMYSISLKRIPLLDTLVLAGLYTLRILAGAAAIVVVPSVWLLSFSMFFFLSLALAKRHSELLEMDDAGTQSVIPGREYIAEDRHTLISQGSAAGYAAVLVLALYIDSAEVVTRYRHPELIWLICPLILYWINKLWLSSARRQINEDPVVWAFRNRVSRIAATLSVAILLAARWLP
jgi:4-hydroxybenzoate polyprenyltransferase